MTNVIPYVGLKDIKIPDFTYVNLGFYGCLHLYGLLLWNQIFIRMIGKTCTSDGTFDYKLRN
ncbi:MAG: hypothetical protein DA329_10270 [Candidatus Nitrosocosmicus sp.]|nr:hypothetical protein [Candidatus Nitrosocosmicus sp.]